MARVVNAIGKGGQRFAESEMNWNRDVIRKGKHELESGIRCIDYFSGRGRKPIEEHLPNLVEDIDLIRKVVCKNISYFNENNGMINMLQ
jgi:hypothetical protein